MRPKGWQDWAPRARTECADRAPCRRRRRTSRRWARVCKGHAGVPVAGPQRGPCLVLRPPGASAAAGAPAGGGSGAGGDPGGAGERGQGEKEHEANKALGTAEGQRRVGIGEIDAVVPVIGDDQPGHHADDQVAPPSTRTAPPGGPAQPARTTP